MVLSVQAVPFHTSAKATPRGAAASSYMPTAMQLLAAVHDTPNRKLFVAPLGFGVAFIAQAVPFQLSASVTSLTGEPVIRVPTAMQLLAAVHDTALRVAWLVAAAGGTGAPGLPAA